VELAKKTVFLLFFVIRRGLRLKSSTNHFLICQFNAFVPTRQKMAGTGFPDGDKSNVREQKSKSGNEGLRAQYR
jgi:hypothetical protein